MYLLVYPLGLYALILHVPYRFLLDKIPQSTVPVLPVLHLIISKPTFSRSFSIDWWLWLYLTGLSFGYVTRCVSFPSQVSNANRMPASK